MALFELTLLAKEAEVETLSDALMEIDALSVSVEDADADTEHEEALWGEPGMPVAREAWQRGEATASATRAWKARLSASKNSPYAVMMSTESPLSTLACWSASTLAPGLRKRASVVFSMKFFLSRFGLKRLETSSTRSAPANEASSASSSARR